jgi:hypothetical protein
MVAMTTDGAVRALIGGINYSKSQFNRVTQARRQPGSAFKLFVYLAALEAGMTPESLVEDAPVTMQVGNTVWSPENYTREYKGFIPMGQVKPHLNPLSTGTIVATDNNAIVMEIVDEDSRVVNEILDAIIPGIGPSREIGHQAPVETHDHNHLVPPETRLDKNLLASSCRLKNTRNSKSRFALLMPRSSNNSFLQAARHRPHPQVPLVDIAKHTLSTNHNSKTILQTKFQN